MKEEIKKTIAGEIRYNCIGYAFLFISVLILGMFYFQKLSIMDGFEITFNQTIELIALSLGVIFLVAGSISLSIGYFRREVNDLRNEIKGVSK